ncbi:MAG: hypothetical protein WBV61_13120 [Rhodanobacteraceae bacterium]
MVGTRTTVGCRTPCNRQASAQIDLLPDTSGIVCLSRRSNRRISRFNNDIVDGNQVITIANRSSEIGFGMTEGARRVRDYPALVTRASLHGQELFRCPEAADECDAIEKSVLKQ